MAGVAFGFAHPARTSLSEAEESVCVLLELNKNRRAGGGCMLMKNDDERSARLVRGFELALLGLLLALDAMARPWHRFQALRVDFLATGDTLPETAFAEAGESAVHHQKQLAVVVALAKQEFLVVRTRGTIGDILRGLFIGRATVLLVAGNHVAQFLLSCFQSFSEVLQLLLFHDRSPLRSMTAASQSPKFA